MSAAISIVRPPPPLPVMPRLPKRAVVALAAPNLSDTLDEIVGDGVNLIELRKLGKRQWLAQRRVDWMSPGSFTGGGSTPARAISDLFEKIDVDRRQSEADTPEAICEALEASIAAAGAPR